MRIKKLEKSVIKTVNFETLSAGDLFTLNDLNMVDNDYHSNGNEITLGTIFMKCNEYPTVVSLNTGIIHDDGDGITLSKFTQVIDVTEKYTLVEQDT